MSTRAATPYLGIDVDTDDWTSGGMCREVHPDLRFPEQGQNVAWAKQICAVCPVTAECLEAALAVDERFGVWGGLTVADRDRHHGRRSA